MLGKFNLGALMKGAKKVQEMMEKNQEELSKAEVTGESGAGLVKVVMNGLHIVKELQVADELMTESKEVIQDLIAAAFNNATQKASKLAQAKLTDMTQLFRGMDGEGAE
ncbi:MAG: YbaB/EbfC family nucleoid-associated protein [Proteobacteria bacterium]|nr:YbaB/EbfC family nucleoid-associated protein [Pseudomonadota bacterium]